MKVSFKTPLLPNFCVSYGCKLRIILKYLDPKLVTRNPQQDF